MRKEERDRIKARRDGLVARIAELEKVLLEEFTGHPHTCPAWNHSLLNPDESLCECDARIAVEVLNRQPRQSLDMLRAEVLEEMADSGYFNGAAWQIGEMLIDRAGQLRNKAEQP